MSDQCLEYEFYTLVAALASGVSGRLKQLAGPEPFRQLAGTGVMRPGTVCLTDGGKLKTPIIHAAALNMFWRSSESIVHCCTDAALNLTAVKGFHSVAFPLLGSGIGGLTPSTSLEAMTRAIEINQYSKTLDIKIITYLNEVYDGVVVNK